MGTLQQEADFFRKIYPKMEKNVQNTLDVETRALRDRIATRSPVGKTGQYQKAWRVNKTRGTGNIANSSISNPSRQASAIEYGIYPGDFPNHPWVVSFIKGGSTGVEAHDGNIWSAKAVGGSMMPEFTSDYKTKLTKLLANSAMRAFK